MSNKTNEEGLNKVLDAWTNSFDDKSHDDSEVPTPHCDNIVVFFNYLSAVQININKYNFSQLVIIYHEIDRWIDICKVTFDAKHHVYYTGIIVNAEYTLENVMKKILIKNPDWKL